MSVVCKIKEYECIKCKHVVKIEHNFCGGCGCPVVKENIQPIKRIPISDSGVMLIEALIEAMEMEARHK